MASTYRDLMWNTTTWSVKWSNIIINILLLFFHFCLLFTMCHSHSVNYRDIYLSTRLGVSHLKLVLVPATWSAHAEKIWSVRGLMIIRNELLELINLLIIIPHKTYMYAKRTFNFIIASKKIKTLLVFFSYLWGAEKRCCIYCHIQHNYDYNGPSFRSTTRWLFLRLQNLV